MPSMIAAARCCSFKFSGWVVALPCGGTSPRSSCASTQTSRVPVARRNGGNRPIASALSQSRATSRSGAFLSTPENWGRHSRPADDGRPQVSVDNGSGGGGGPTRREQEGLGQRGDGDCHNGRTG